MSMDIEGPADVIGRMPTPQERKTLGISEGVPVFEITREGPDGPETELVAADKVILKINRPG
ncbi:hypothetical protein [Streptosporangium saharense]|uniref:hypothetical protein n=1 Tax=Streptosporangium saharense TaxID=1706840 RepID=UPI00341D3B47